MKRIWKGLGVAAIALVLGAGALVFLAPVGGFKAPLEAEVASATGRAFHIEGPVRLTFTPELALDLGPVTLGAGQGPDATPLVAARRAVLAVAFLPLLSGDARATGLTLEGADIQIGRGGEGWIFTAADGAQTATPFDALDFGDLRLVDSRIHIGDTEIIAHDVRMRWASRGQTLSLSGDVAFREHSFSLEAVIERRDALMAGGRVPLRIEFDSDLAEGSIDGVADLARLGFEGGVSLSAASTRALAAFLGAAIPGDRAFGELSLSAAVKAAPGQVSLRDVKFALGGMTGAGTVSVRLSGDRPEFTGRVAVDRFALGDFLGFSPVEGANGLPDLAFDLSGLSGFEADLTVKAREADIFGLNVENVAMTMSGRAGRLWARIDSAIAYAAILHGTLTAEAAGAGAPKLGLTLAAEGFDTQAAFAAAFGGAGLTGHGNIKLDLTAEGATRQALIASLAGSAEIVLIDGALDGIDPAELARTAAAEGGPTGLGGDAAIAFKRLSGAFDMLNGRARSDSLRLVSNTLRVDASGAFDLPARTVELRALPAFTADVDGQRDPADDGRLAMPFAVSGAWGALVAEPDWAALMTALQSGRVALEAIDLLPEPRRSWFKGLIASGQAPPWPAGIARPDAPAHWQPW